MTISSKVQGAIERSSWIRRMFEEGAALVAKYGAENVFDFTLGNPSVAAATTSTSRRPSRRLRVPAPRCG